MKRWEWKGQDLVDAETDELILGVDYQGNLIADDGHRETADYVRLFEPEFRNGRLIAKAPELAEVLRDLVSECEAAQGPEIRDDPVWGPLLSKAVEVLARIDNGNSDDQK